jgi:hypothetical protein
MDHLPLLTQIIEQELGGALLHAKEITGGYAGYVYVVRAAVEGRPRTVCCKLTPLETPRNAWLAPVDVRVGGSVIDNLPGAYALLAQAGFRLPELYASGRLEAGEPLAFQVMELLEGISIREFVAYGEHERMEPLHELAGETLGRLHSVVRAYDGLCDQPAPDPLGWKAAFFASLQNVLSRASDRNTVLRRNAGTIERFVSRQEALWTNPAEFVLSHIDGLQAMARYTNECWTLTGLVDIEDHRFVDPRSALAGYELSLHYEGRTLPAAFWRGYGRFKRAPASYLSLRNLFFLYDLLGWLCGCYEDWRGPPERRAPTLSHFEALILAAVRESEHDGTLQSR